MREDITAYINNLLEDFMHLLPRLVLAVLCLLIGFLIAILVKKIINRFILYLNESMNQKLNIRMLNVDLKTSAKFISTAFYWVIVLLAFLISIRILRLDFLATWFDQIIKYLPNVIAAIVIVFAGIVSGKLLGDLVQSAANRTGVANGQFIGRIVRYLILIIAIVIAVDQVGVEIAFLTNLFIVILASLLIGASLAFALGAKTSVSNILGAHYVRKTHQLGMKIRIDDIEGIIIKITDHAITIQTEAGLMIIPAKDFSESRVLILND